jgi:hypothetical protein
MEVAVILLVVAVFLYTVADVLRFVSKKLREKEARLNGNAAVSGI